MPRPGLQSSHASNAPKGSASTLFKRGGKPDYVLMVLLAAAILLFLLLMAVLWLRMARGPEILTNVKPSYPEIGKRWLSYGDSITDHGFWQETVWRRYGLDHYDAGRGGTCVCGFGPNPFWSEARLNEIMQADPDLITIMGGTNDFLSAYPLGDDTQFDKAPEQKDIDTFIGAYSYIIEVLRNWKPNVQIVVMTTPNNFSSFQSDNKNNAGLTVADYAEACRQVAAHYGLICVDVFSIPYADADAFYAEYTDGIHPNLQGAQKIGELVAQAISVYYPNADQKTP